MLPSVVKQSQLITWDPNRVVMRDSHETANVKNAAKYSVQHAFTVELVNCEIVKQLQQKALCASCIYSINIRL